MQISFPTQQPFTANLFLPQSQSHLEITFNRYQTCLYPSTLKQGNKIKLGKVQTLSPFWIERSIASSTTGAGFRFKGLFLGKTADLTSRTSPKSGWRRAAGEKKRRNRSRYLEAKQGARNVSLPRASDDPPREKRSRISRADPLEVARAVALSERRQAALLRTQTTAASMLPLSLSFSLFCSRSAPRRAMVHASRPNFDRDKHWIRQI